MFLDPHNISSAAAESAKRQPYNFSIPRLCFHPTELFPDRGDTIDINKVEPEEVDTSNPSTANKKNSPGVQPQFRVVVGPRLWDFMTVVQYVGFNDMSSFEPTNTDTKNQSSHFSLKSRHVLMTGAPGSGKSTLLMTAAAFMTYRTMTNIYRVAGIGDARSWASSGDPYMYFALEMLVALRDYNQKQRHYDCESGDEYCSRNNSNNADFPNQQPLDQPDDYSKHTDDTAVNSDEEEWGEEAGFLIEPRALASVSDVRSWIYAIRDRLAQSALSTPNYDGNNNCVQQQHYSKRDLRLKLIVMVDQAEYLLQHPDSIPAQIIQTLLELHNPGIADTSCQTVSFFPSVILSVSSVCPSLGDQFPPSNLLDLIRKQMIPSGQCLTYHVPSRLDSGMSERVSRLAIRRSMTLSHSLRRHPLRQWERDLIASGEVRQWTGSVAGELVRFYKQVLTSSSSNPNANRIAHLLDSYTRFVHDSVFTSISSYLSTVQQDLRSEKRRLLAIILRMALHMPLSSDDLSLALPIQHLFLPLITQCHLALIEKSSLPSSHSQSLPTVQHLFHPREGVIRMDRIPTAVSMAVHTALLQSRLMALLETKANPTGDDPSSSTLSRYLDSLVQASFPDACSEARRRLITFYTRTRLTTTQVPGCAAFLPLTGKSQLNDPVQVPLSGFVQYFSGMVACPAILWKHIAVSESNNNNIILVPTRFDYPYFEFFILDVKAKHLYVVCTAKEIWAWIKNPDTMVDSSNSVLPSVNTPSTTTTTTLDSSIVSSDISSHGGILTPQSLLDAWQDSIQELFTHSDNQGTSLDATIKVYDDFFSTAQQSSKTPGAPSTTAKKKIIVPPSAPTTKKRKPVISVKLVFVEDCRVLAKCFGLVLP